MYYQKVTKILFDKMGFSLIEFLLVLSVIAILAAVTLSVISTSPEKLP